MFAIKDWQSYRGLKIRQDGLGAALRVLGRAIAGSLPCSRALTDQTCVKRDTPALGTAALTAFDRDEKFASRIVKQGNTDVVVGETGLQLLNNLRQYFVGIQRSDGVARNQVQEAEMAGFGALVLKEAGIFDGDT